MPIELSEHALLRLKKRNISEELVIEVTQDPEEILPSFRGRKLRRRKIDDRILEVVTKTEGSRITIVTAYFLEE